MSADDHVRAASGYVEVPGGPICGNCEYARGNWCELFAFVMDRKNGCCSYWESDREHEHVTHDYLEEAKG